MTSRLRRSRGDEGASLILVLVFVASFSIIVPALLTQAQTNVSTVATTRDVVSASYDAEAVAEKTINDLRNGSFYNAPGQPCFPNPADATGATDTSARFLDNGGLNTGRDVLVTCQAKADTGHPSSILVEINNSNRPGQALLTLSRAAGAGITHDKNNILRIQGRVFSNSGVTVSNSNALLQVSNAALIARGTCTGPITAIPRTCNDTSQDSLGVDPAYPLPATTPVTTTVPTCSSSAGVVLSPGLYTDAVALSRLTNTCGALVHFLPGTYSFDFAASDPVWSITDGYVIGGSIPTAAGRNWSLAAYPGVKPRIPGSCVSPTEPQTNGGVRFVFNGASRMSVSGGGKVELCGEYSTTRPPIAVFGANASNGTAPVSATITKNNSNGGSDFANQNNIRVMDTITSNAAVVGRNASQRTALVTAEMPFTGSLPAGAQLTSARLRVTHRDVPGPTVVQGSNTYSAGPITSLLAAVRPTAGRAPGDNAYRPATNQPVISPTMIEDVLDVTAQLKPEFDGGAFTGISAQFTAGVALNTAATEQLDSMILEITYQVPGFRTTLNACGGAPCTIINANGSNPETQLYVQGTTYTPYSDLDITLNNVSAQVFRFGLISNRVRVALTGSSSFAEAVISVPDVSSEFGELKPPLVHLQVYVCELDGGCPAPATSVPQGYVPATGSGWVRQVSTRVRFIDTAFPPVPSQRRVEVVTWNHPRYQN